MRVRIYPSQAAGRAYAPPSKSAAHRALICAALSGGRCVIDNVAFSDDIEATLRGITALGARVTRGERSVTVEPDGRRQAVIDCGESGSTLRFLIPLALDGEKTEFRGSSRLLRRPLDVYEKLCRERGFEFALTDALTVRGTLKSGVYRLRADVSSQFITGLMLALARLPDGGVIELEGEAESKPYIALTADIMRAFGAEVTAGDSIVIKGGGYSPRDFTVEGDASNAAYLAAFGVPVDGVSPDTAQGDRVYAEYFDAVRRGYTELDVANCPDLAPALIALMAMNGGGKLTGTRRLKIKESDRGNAMAEELAKLGARVKVAENEIEVTGGVHAPDAPLCGRNDHRVVMALAAVCARTGGVIEGAEAVKKSFPDFFERIGALGVRYEYEA